MKWLNEDERWEVLVNVWSEVKMLTGAIMHTNGPEGEMLNIQLATLERCLISNPKFASLTKNEILHAFYMNSAQAFADYLPGPETTFRHYNKELNGEFVGDVLGAYVREKAKMYRHKDVDINRALNPAPEDTRQEVKPEVWRQQIQQDYELYREGSIEWIFNASPKYLFLRKCGLVEFTNRQKWCQWYGRALEQREYEISSKPVTSEGQRITKDRVLSVFDAIKETGMIPRTEHYTIIHKMRRMVYLKFFEIISDFGINDIFTEIDHKHA